jgi:uncharacterized membrane protein
MPLDIIDPTIAPFVATFLLVFAVVFGLLSYSKMMNFDRRVNALVALAFGLFSIFYPPLVESLYQFMPVVTIALIVLFFLVFIKKIFEEKEEGKQKDTLPTVIALGVMLLVLSIIGGRIEPYLPAGIDLNNLFWIVGILVVIMIFWGIYKYRGK